MWSASLSLPTLIYLAMKHFMLALLCYATYGGAAQKHDQIWVSGAGNSPAYSNYGGAIIDFGTNPPHAYYNYRKLNMRPCNASLCDSSGYLLAYTNGCDIAGANDEIIEGGDTINAGYVNHRQYGYGYSSGSQSAIMLPMPDTMGVVFTFHEHLIYTYNPFHVITDKLLYSVVDMQQNDGKGKVTAKDVPLITGSISFGGLTAVKHANGRDWWVVVPDFSSNIFHVSKLTKQGITDTLTQTIGIVPNVLGEGYGQVVFSPDGSRLYRTNPYNPVMVYDFNRATGVFTAFDTIPYDYGSTLMGEIGCAVSPNGRYLYLSAREHLYQLDLQSADISASQTLVATWDGYAAPLPTLFWLCQLGPDCKIYIKTTDMPCYHVIHHPDELGLACNVEQRGLALPTPSGASMPTFPNFRLGTLEQPGLPCSPVSATSGPALSPLPLLSVFPNPASEYLKIIPNGPLPAGATWVLCDALGRVVRSERLWGTCTEISVADLSAGVYFYRLVGARGVVAQVGKVLIVG